MFQITASKLGIGHFPHVLDGGHILILKPLGHHRCTDFEIVVRTLGAHLLDDLFAIGIEVISEGLQESLTEFVS